MNVKEWWTSIALRKVSQYLQVERNRNKKEKIKRKSALITELCLNPHKELIKFVYYIFVLFFSSLLFPSSLSILSSSVSVFPLFEISHLPLLIKLCLSFFVQLVWFPFYFVTLSKNVPLVLSSWSLCICLLL